MEYFVIPVLFLVVLDPDQVDASTSFMCAQVGGNRETTAHYFDWKSFVGYYTIGASNFKMPYAGAFDSFIQGKYSSGYFSPDTITRNECPYNFNTLATPPVKGSIELCPKNVAMRVYTVQQGERTLQGWLHVEIELLDKSDKIAAIYVQMRDEHANAVGEFVTGDGETCLSSKPELASPTKYQVLPCSAIGVREPKPCSALYMVRKDRLDPTATASTDPRYLGNPPRDPSRGISFTWRLSEYWCNRHSRIRPDAMIVTDNNIRDYDTHISKKSTKDCIRDRVYYDCYYGPHRVLRKGGDYWMKTEWFGGYDIVRDYNGPLKCDDEVMKVGSLIKDKMEPLFPSAKTWIKEITKSKFEHEYVNPKSMYKWSHPDLWKYKSCQVPNAGLSSPSFSGRCVHLFEAVYNYTPSRETIHGCNKDANSEEFQGLTATFQSFKSYKDYTQNLYRNRTIQCQLKPCEMPKPHEKHIILSFPKEEHLQKQSFQDLHGNATRSQTSVARFLFGRKYHGMMCIFTGMFLSSISMFSARYLKETFMEFSCMGLNFWFYVHVGCSIGSIGFYFTSVTALMANVESWGRSQNGFAFLHNYLGWFSLVLFGILFISGGLRCGRRIDQIHIRTVCLSFHSVTGFVHYIINVAAIGFSTRIPGSPSVDKCNRKGMPEKKGLAVIAKLVIVWLIIDISFHIFLTIILVMGDKKRELQRGLYCPILPVMPSSDAGHDVRGSGLRKLLFIFYCILCFGFSFGAIGYLASSQLPKGCVFGEMSCNLKKFPFGCSQVAKAYADALKRASGYKKDQSMLLIK